MDEVMIQVEPIQYIVVKYGDELFGIDIKYVDNIVRMQRTTRVPKVQPFIKGVINLRGEVIPVISLRLKMGLADDEITKATRIIIIKLETGESIGVLVDEVQEVVTLEGAQIEKVKHDGVNANTKQSYISGVGKDRDRLISLLDVNIAFGEKEN